MPLALPGRDHRPEREPHLDGKAARWPRPGSDPRAVREAAAGPGPFQLPARFAPLADDLGTWLDPVGYSRWAFTPAIPFMRGYEAALREAHQTGRLTASAG